MTIFLSVASLHTSLLANVLFEPQNGYGCPRFMSRRYSNFVQHHYSSIVKARRGRKQRLDCTTTFKVWNVSTIIYMSKVNLATVTKIFLRDIMPSSSHTELVDGNLASTSIKVGKRHMHFRRRDHCIQLALL